MDIKEKEILDVTCGDRMIWFQKNHPKAVYCDKRREEWAGVFGVEQKHRHLVIDPDVQCDFTDLPFEDNSFSLVVFDPPHIKNLTDSSWMKKSYGSLYDGWEQMLHDGFHECMRVLKPNGVLVFKWSDISISTREVITAFGQEPLFGHRSGKKMNTHWMCYMKDGEAEPVRHGRWDASGRYRFEDGSLAIRCDVCGAALHEDEWQKYHWHYCPNCGAKMDGEQK